MLASGVICLYTVCNRPATVERKPCCTAKERTRQGRILGRKMGGFPGRETVLDFAQRSVRFSVQSTCRASTSGVVVEDVLPWGLGWQLIWDDQVGKGLVVISRDGRERLHGTDALVPFGDRRQLCMISGRAVYSLHAQPLWLFLPSPFLPI